MDSQPRIMWPKEGMPLNKEVTIKMLRRVLVEIINYLQANMKSHLSFLRNAMLKMMITNLFSLLKKVLKSQNKKLLPKMKWKDSTGSMITLAFTFLFYNMGFREIQ